MGEEDKKKGELEKQTRLEARERERSNKKGKRRGRGCEVVDKVRSRLANGAGRNRKEVEGVDEKVEKQEWMKKEKVGEVEVDKKSRKRSRSI